MHPTVSPNQQNFDSNIFRYCRYPNRGSKATSKVCRTWISMPDTHRAQFSASGRTMVNHTYAIHFTSTLRFQGGTLVHQAIAVHTSCESKCTHERTSVASKPFANSMTEKPNSNLTFRHKMYVYSVSKYITLGYLTLRYITLHHLTLHYITLHYITLHYSTVQYSTLPSMTSHHITLDYITLYIIHYTLYIIHYTLYIIHYTLYTIHYTLYIIHYTLHYITLHCILFYIYMCVYIIFATAPHR